jgi:hypothetical protein
VTTHQRQRRIRNPGQTIEQLPAARHEFNPFLRRIEPRELLDVSASDEARRFPGAEDQPLRRAAVELIEQL